MIDISQEHILSLPQATAALPKVDGKRVHVSSIWRWCRKGLSGVRLEHVKIGGRLCTSREALNRFANALAEADEVAAPPLPTTPVARTDRQRATAIASAEAQLKAAGI